MGWNRGSATVLFRLFQHEHGIFWQAQRTRAQLTICSSGLTVTDSKICFLIIFNKRQVFSYEFEEDKVICRTSIEFKKNVGNVLPFTKVKPEGCLTMIVKRLNQETDEDAVRKVDLV